MKNISIIVPVYNVEKYVEQCLNSIVKQMNNNHEIIIVNDGSTDRSLEICMQYQNTYDNVKIINQDNKGLSGARNTGIKNAKGEYLLFVDSDDYIEEGAIELIEKTILTKKDFYLTKSKSFIDGKKEFNDNQLDYGKLDVNDIPSDIFIKLHKEESFWFAAWLLIVNRNFIIDNNLYFEEGIYHEDELWVPQVFIKAKNIGFINAGIYLYRTCRADSIISNKKIKKELDKAVIIEKLNLTINNNSSEQLVRDRCAALVFGMILNYVEYVDFDAEQKLRNNIKKYAYCLRWRKYWLVYLCLITFGIRLTSSIFSKFVTE